MMKVGRSGYRVSIYMILLIGMLLSVGLIKADVHAAGANVLVQNVTNKTKKINGKLRISGKQKDKYQIKAKIGKKTFHTVLSKKGNFSIRLNRSYASKTKVHFTVYRKVDNAWRKCGYKLLRVKKYTKSIAKKYKNTIKIYDISRDYAFLNVGKKTSVRINAPKVKWKTSNKKVATVNSKGMITAVSTGICDVKGSVNGISLSCKVYVPSLSADTIILADTDPGKTLVLYNAGSSVTYKTSNKKVAVYENGKVVPKGGGICTITASVKGRKYPCKVYVPTLSAERLVFSEKDSGKGLILRNAYGTAAFTSSNAKVAVYENGKVVPKGSGTCTITAKLMGKSFTCKVFVPSFSASQLSVSESSKGKALVLNHIDKPVTYKSSDTKVAVYEDGKVVPKSAGTCVITASVDGKKFTCNVTVKGAPDTAVRFLNNLEKYSRYIKAHYQYFTYKYDGSLTTFEMAKKKVEKGQKVGITCVVPCRWSLAEMGIKRKDGKSLLSGNNGSFGPHYTGDMPVYLNRYTSGGPVGMTVKNAVDKGLLRPGDILANKDQTHTYVYSGKGYMVYEGAPAYCKDYSNGVYVSYEKSKKIINEVLRWK